MPRVAYGCCVGSWDKMSRYVTPRVVGRPLVAISGALSIAFAYNAILNVYRGQNFDMLVLLHDDLELVDPNAEEKLLAAVREPNVALVGVIGGVEVASLYWWNSPTIVGHQSTDNANVDPGGPREGDVLFIEGSIMALSPWAIEYLRFDERYPGFLGYDDVCMQARAAGKRSLVIDVDTHHHSTVGWKSEAIRDNFAECERLFREKWGLNATNDV